MLLSSVSANALAGQGNAVIIADDANGGAADGLKARLENAGYTVTFNEGTAGILNSLDSYMQVWDVRYNTPLSNGDSTGYLSYLNADGGLFLLGENAGFATRNNSITTFISAAGGGEVSYSATTVEDQYVTNTFNGAATVAPDSGTSFYVPAAGTIADPGNGVFITTTQANGAGDGTGVAFGVGTLSNAPTGRLLAYFDVNTFQEDFMTQTPALRNLVDRMISFVAGDFQADPNLPPIGGPAIIDGSQPSFDLTDAAAQGETITFNGGTLQLTGGADPQNNIASAVVINTDGAFVDTTGATATFSGDVSGDGGLIVSGGGVLALAGTNTYHGGTVITGDSTVVVTQTAALGDASVSLMSGTLAYGADVTGGTGVALFSGANAINTGASNVTNSGVITGPGGFTKEGSGRLNLTGVNTYNGATTVEDGRLSVNGSIANSVVTVEDGAFIGGNGTVGGLIVRTNATAAPGNSIGQLTAATTVLFQVGSTYEVEADADGSSDKLIASGAATIEGGTVKVLAANGAYNPRTAYTILEAASVTGKFAGVTSNLAFLTPTLGYSNTDIVLTLTRNDMTFASAGVTFNQRSTGAAIDGAFGSTTAVYDQLVGMSAPQAQAAFDSLSGEIHGSALSVAAGNADNVRRTVLGRFDTTDGARSEIWGQALNTWNDLDGHANTGSVESKAPGFLVGGEMNMGEFRVGLAGGYTDADATLLARNSRADVKGAHAAFYAGAPLGVAKVRVGASYTAINLHTSRTATVGAISDQLTSRYDAHATQAFGEIGYGMTLAGTKIEPFVGVNALWLNNGAFTEQGGQTALDGAQRSRDTAWSTLGLKADFTPSANLPISIQLKGGWQHALTDVATDSEVAFAAGGPAFVVQGAPLAKDAGVIDANLGWLLKNSAKLSVGYSGVIADQGQDHTAKITMSIPL